jgi:hypothetical protein
VRIAHAALIAFGVMSVLTSAATAQLIDNLDIFIIPTSNPAPSLNFGLDDGNGFIFGTLTDDDGDGLIQLPRVPIPGRLALDITPTAGGVPGCDIWDFMSNGVQKASVPLFVNALTGESLGVDYGELMVPPFSLTPGQQFTVVNGMLPGWPDIRLVDVAGVPDLESFVQVVDTLPGFSGQVLVSDTIVDFTLVPEPSTLLGVLLASCILLTCRRSDRPIH